MTIAQEANRYPTPVLETARLRLRPFEPGDWRDLQAYVAQEAVMLYDHPWPASDHDCQQLCRDFAQREGFWAVCVKPEPRMVGHVVCSRSGARDLRTWNIGFVLHPDFHGQGYATEAARRVLAHVFGAWGAHRVIAGCHADNTPSWRLLERLGLRREAHHRQAGYVRKTPDGQPLWSDSYEYAILDEEWWSQQ